jgi:hypothetical protein
MAHVVFLRAANVGGKNVFRPARLAGRAKARPSPPLLVPAGREWRVRLDRVDGAYALGLCHRRPGGFTYPSLVV